MNAEQFLFTPLVIPLYQIGLLMLLSTLALLFGRIRVALIINYIFTVYWGYILNREVLVGFGFEQITLFSVIYFIFGGAVVLLAVIGLLAYN